jgi:hypothetical protein
MASFLFLDVIRPSEGDPVFSILSYCRSTIILADCVSEKRPGQRMRDIYSRSAVVV